MDDKLYKILKKVYFKKRYVKDQNGYQQPIKTGDKFDCATKTTNFSIDILNEAEKEYLLASCYPINEVVGYTHDECIQAYKKLLGHPNLNMDNLIAAYICGFSSFPRGRQPILSYLFARAVPEHSFISDPGYDHCNICCVKGQEWVQKGEEIFRKYAGYSWVEFWGRFLVGLQEFAELPPCIPAEEDIRIFRELISLIRNATPGETPGKLEERVRKSKIISGYEKYRFRGQLLVLAELGVMPNDYLKPLYDGFTPFKECCEIKTPFKGSARSDVTPPLAYWRGDRPLDEERLNELFGRYL